LNPKTSPHLAEKFRGKNLKCKNIRFQNNLVLESQHPADLVFFDHPRGSKANQLIPGDLGGLLTSPQWRFSHNWREIDPEKTARYKDRWIPPNHDRAQARIEVLSRTLGDPNFLRPAKDSPLTKGGVNDGSLPAYVGSVPPEGMEPWDWDKTWKALASGEAPTIAPK